ncbi:hypothetical protein PUN4_230022 [Paraburkholderia unamae]|nr:hypothetical protein PUN4_230022 [Paraburkholderia unamae]
MQVDLLTIPTLHVDVMDFQTCCIFSRPRPYNFGFLYFTVDENPIRTGRIFHARAEHYKPEAPECLLGILGSTA